MPRIPRVCLAGDVYHVLNRGVRRQRLFETVDDYRHFQRLLGRAATRVPMRLLAYCMMPNHWHLVVWPLEDHAVSAYVQWLSSAHARHFNVTAGTAGHVYQGRFRSVPVRDDRQLWALLQYVESNPARAGLVERAEQWRWSSLTPSSELQVSNAFPRPANWLELLASGSDAVKTRETA
jgi:putative transposase